MDRNELPPDPRHLGVPLGVHKMISMPVVHSAQIVHLSCVEINTISKQTKTSFHLTHVTSEYHRMRPKWFLILWYVWAQTVLLSCVEINTISRQSEIIFHKIYAIWCAQKRFQSLWYIWHKQCTYLAVRLIHSPNRSKRASTWSTTPRNTIGCA
jgi:hypothetical protein